MLHLITGTNGAGKTLNTLKWVRERSLKENRPVCHNGRFSPVAGGELSTWKQIEFKDWQNEPDGTIFVIDECHNDLPTRGASASVPDEVRMLAEHRRRGMDFYLITQHPQNVDNFVRRLIGSPGWHRHLKRTFGADLVSCIEWDAVNPNCEKPGSGKSGTVTMVPFPKEVYSWYTSASLHTGKKKIPRAVWIAVASLIIAPALIYFAVSGVYSNVKKDRPDAQSKSSAASTVRPAAESRVLTAAEYVDARTPRIPGFPHTAPAYDAVTQPIEAPYPAACVSMGKRCDCYTQQATLMQVDAESCLQIVKRGYFVDFKFRELSRPVERSNPPAHTPVNNPQPITVVVQNDHQSKNVAPDDVYTQSLALRNAQVRSVFQAR